MDCNKEEAVRAVTMAEKKMQMKDFIGAKKLALKAQQLFPGLENISHLLTVCEVHCSAATSINGSEDWYSILQVEVTADVLSIKKQYRKFALLLHPDKNKFAGAESAFKLIGEAHRTLTDQAKRSLYDLKRKPVHPRIQPQTQHQNRNSFVNMPSGFNFSNQGSVHTGSFQQPQKQTPATVSPTFWTVCPFCGMKYQYYRSVMDMTIRCQNCFQTFNAYDVDVQGATMKAKQCSNQQVNNGIHNTKFQGNTSGKSTVMDFGLKAGGEVGVSSRSKPKEGIQVDDDSVKENKVKFENVSKFSSKREAAPEYPGKQKRKKKNTVLSDTESSDDEEVLIANDFRKSSDGIVNEPRRSTRKKQNVIYNEDGDEEDESNDIGTVSPLKRLRKGGSSCHSENAVPSESGVNKGKIHSNQSTVVKSAENITNDETSAKNANKAGNLKGDSEAQEREATQKNDSDSVINLDSDASEKDNPIIAYPDPEFFDFQGSRDASSFATDAIWAIYDDSDGMPRFYVRIRNVVDIHSFKVCFTWLEHEPLSGVEVDWSKNDLPVACGNFTLGKTQTSVDLPMFSHCMSCESGSRRNTYTIHPRKGEVWALFKGWDIKWIQDPEKHRSYEYEIVKILSDYKHDSGILVANLIKVKGFVSLFARAANKKTGVLQIRHDEMLRFSHMIPCHKMTGEEREGVPGGSYELDTASLPPNFDVAFPSASFDHISANVEDRNKVDTRSKRENHLRTCEDVLPNRASKDSMRERGRNEASCAAEVGNGMHPNKEESRNATSAIYVDTAPFDYPDTEFHSFESERSFDKIQPGQIWALYSDIDGFPKYYAMVTEVDVGASRVHMTWLDICPDRTEEIQWFNKDLPFGCGRYKLLHGKKKSEMYVGLETFSHQIPAEAGGKKNMYFIYPRVGEIWAIYRNWNAAWEAFDSDKCDYDVVEIKCRTQHAIDVIPLEKVKGHHVVFKHITKNDSGMMVILRSEWLRFSHQIPSFLLTEERGGKLRGYWELDPASVPETLLYDS